MWEDGRVRVSLCSAGIGTGARGCAGTRVPGRAARGAIDETGRDARPRALTLRLLLPHLAPHARQPRRVL